MFTRTMARVTAVSRLLILLGVVGVGSTGYVAYQGGRDRVEETFGPPIEKTKAVVSNGWDKTEDYAERGWSKVEENPVPIVLAVLTLLMTVVYHKAKGKTLRQAMEVAVTKVNTIEVNNATPRSTAATRAQARATYQQLERDQKELEERLKILPGAIEISRRNLTRASAESKAADATANEKKLNLDRAEMALAKLVNDQETAEQQLEEIDDELHKLLSQT